MHVPHQTRSLRRPAEQGEPAGEQGSTVSVHDFDVVAAEELRQTPMCTHVEQTSFTEHEPRAVELSGEGTTRARCTEEDLVASVVQTVAQMDRRLLGAATLQRVDEMQDAHR